MVVTSSQAQIMEKTKSPKLDATFWVAQIIFIISGVSQNIMSYEVGRIGITAKPWNMINVFFNYFGQQVFCVLYDYRTLSKINWQTVKLFAPVAFFDVIGCINYYVALQLIGSGILSVLYAFIIVVTGILNRIVFGKNLSWYSWACLFVITAGIVLCSESQLSDSTGSDFIATLIGIIMAIATTLAYGTSFVMINARFDEETAPEQHVGAFAMGCSAFPVSVLYSLCVLLPLWDDWVREPVLHADEEATPGKIAGYCLLLIALNGMHQVSAFYCLSFGEVASITAGVSKALQASSTFIVSDWLFCKHEKSQCMTTMKDIGVGIACTGVLFYSVHDLIFAKKKEERSMSINPGKSSTAYAILSENQ